LDRSGRWRICNGSSIRNGWVSVLVGVGVIVGVAVAVGMDAIMDEVVALTEETNCVIINTSAINPATMPRDAKDLLK